MKLWGKMVMMNREVSIGSIIKFVVFTLMFVSFNALVMNIQDKQDAMRMQLARLENYNQRFDELNSKLDVLINSNNYINPCSFRPAPILDITEVSE
jgi:hypothetical protein